MDLESGLNSPRRNNNTIVRPPLGLRQHIYRVDTSNDNTNPGKSIACLCGSSVIIVGLAITY